MYDVGIFIEGKYGLHEDDVQSPGDKNTLMILIFIFL